METTELLKLIKMKIFDTRKKFFVNNLGQRELISSGPTWFSERLQLSKEDQNILEAADGWNVADKDYVDSKISEFANYVFHQPSAPLKMCIILHSIGIVEKDKLLFFSPGLLIKKGWVLKEINILSGNTHEHDMSLFIKTDQTSTLLSKISANGKHILSADVNHQFESLKSIIFEIVSPKHISCSLQITIEH